MFHVFHLFRRSPGKRKILLEVCVFCVPFPYSIPRKPLIYKGGTDGTDGTEGTEGTVIFYMEQIKLYPLYDFHPPKARKPLIYKGGTDGTDKK